MTSAKSPWTASAARRSATWDGTPDQHAGVGAVAQERPLAQPRLEPFAQHAHLAALPLERLGTGPPPEARVGEAAREQHCGEHKPSA